MSTFQKIISTLLFLLPAGLFAQASYIGSWKMTAPMEDGQIMEAKLTINEAGTYTVDLGIDGTVDVNGKYEVAEGKMFIQDTDGSGACLGPEMKGTYAYEVSESMLTMTRISDPCANRGGPEGKMVFSRM